MCRRGLLLQFIKISFCSYPLFGQVDIVGDQNFDITFDGSLVSLPLFSNHAITTSPDDITRAVIVIQGQNRNADDYYNSRALGSRIGAWASKQSSILNNRTELLDRIKLMENKFKSNPPRPDFWGGIRIRPLSIEFWKEGKYRLHERELWKRGGIEDDWSINNLYP